MKQTVLLISCEHAVDTVPEEYHYLFETPEAKRHLKKSSDLGAKFVARTIAEQLGCPIVENNVSRLLIDCNRSLNHSRCFSKYTRQLSNTDKEFLITHFYQPFRTKAKELIEQNIQAGHQVLHVSLHTFTPVLKGFRQNAGIGLLYDSKRHGEKEVARIWHGLLLQETLPYRIRYNYPFPGNSDNHTKSLRRAYSEKDYLGIEVEINQALFAVTNAEIELSEALSHSLNELMSVL